MNFFLRFLFSFFLDIKKSNNFFFMGSSQEGSFCFNFFIDPGFPQTIFNNFKFQQNL